MEQNNDTKTVGSGEDVSPEENSGENVEIENAAANPPITTSKLNPLAPPFVPIQHGPPSTENSTAEMAEALPHSLHTLDTMVTGSSLPFDRTFVRTPINCPDGYDTFSLPTITPLLPFPNYYCQNFSTPFGATVLPDGVIQLHLRDHICVDIALDKTVRVIDEINGVTIALSGDGDSAALIHPSGCVYQHDSIVQIVAYDRHNVNNFVRYVNLMHKGITFTSESNVLTYLLDGGGVRTTTDMFADMNEDYATAVFFNGSRRGPDFVDEANLAIAQSKFQRTEGGTEELILNGISIVQTPDGYVSLVIDGGNNREWVIRTSGKNVFAKLTTSVMYCTASVVSNHFFVRSGERSVYCNLSSFIVRHGGTSAGFNDRDMLTLF